ncbi:MAG: hypothetical protein IT436_12050 [Phycisphaerales bacterium]|nr:hypothetical protein [Phycisphaerales bacterium]
MTTRPITPITPLTPITPASLPRRACSTPARAARLAAIALFAATTAAQTTPTPAPASPPVNPPASTPPADPGPASSPSSTDAAPPDRRSARPIDTRSDPVFNSEGVDELTLEMLKRRPAPPPVAPVMPRVRIVIPPDIGQATNPFIGLNPAGLGAAKAELLPEGAFLVRRRGSVVKSDSGDWVFLAHPDRQGAAERAMVLLPSPGLEQIEDDLARTGPRAVCYLTGQVLVYRWQNYILPTALSVIPAEQITPPEPASTPEATPDAAPAPSPTPATTQPDAQPQPGPASAESVIRDLEQRRSQPRSISRPTTPTQPAPAADPSASPEPRAISEPSLLSERRARVTRLIDGRLAIAFDRGFGPGPESTMPLLECSALQRLEAQSLNRADAAVFSITGRAVPYRGRTYFLLSGFHITAPSDVNSLQ